MGLLGEDSWVGRSKERIHSGALGLEGGGELWKSYYSIYLKGVDMRHIQAYPVQVDMISFEAIGKGLLLFQ